MIKSLLRCYLLTLLFFAFIMQGISQRACTVTLNQAQDEFEAGHLYSIPSMLKDCLDKGFSTQEKITAYWLLTRTYLLIDDPISAEANYLELLKLDPEYKIDEENDPIEIVFLSKKFKTTPIFEYTILKGGVNFSQSTVIHQYGVYNTNTNKEDLFWGTRYQFGPGAAFNINSNFSINAELLFSLKSFSGKTSLFAGSNAQFPDRLNYAEKQTWLDIPVYVRYQRTYGKWTPYVYLGYSVNLLLNAKASTTFENLESTGSNNSEVNDINISNQRNLFSTAWLAGLGTRYRIGYRYLTLEARYSGGMNNLLKAGNEYELNDGVYNTDLLFKNPRVDSDFRMNHITVMLGYVWPIYKARRVDEKEGWLRNVFKKKAE